MRTDYEVIVIGLGGIGSAALYWLARRIGSGVLGIEQFSLSHPYGASQDHSRIIRLAYDDPAYAALTPHTYPAWREIEMESGLQLVFNTGGLFFGPGGEQTVIDRYARAMDATGIPYERLDPDEAMRRYPQFRLRADDQVLFQGQAGLVDPNKATATHIALARARGAQVQAETPVRILPLEGEGVRVETASGRYTARRLVVAAGAWTNKVLQPLGVQLPLTVTEEQVTYFATTHLREFTPDRFPIWIWHGEYGFYGFPIYGEVATKAGQDVGGDIVTAEDRKLAPNPRPLENLQRFLQEHIPDFLGPVLYTKPCLYTMPPDRGFILDRLPEAPQVFTAVGAGHAFKFSCLLGRMLSDLALDGDTPYDIRAFRLGRPAILERDYPSELAIGGAVAQAE